MRKFCDLILCFCLCLMGCGGTPTQKTIPGETYDAGAVFYSITPTVVHAFTVTNTTGRDIRIKDVRRSCTCTDATVDRRELKNGESAILTMSIKTRPVYHDWDVSTSLETDDSNNPFWNYRVLFRTYSLLRFDEGVIDFGENVNETIQSNAKKLKKLFILKPTALSILRSLVSKIIPWKINCASMLLRQSLATLRANRLTILSKEVQSADDVFPFGSS